MNEKVVAKGKIFELVQIEQPDGRVFEVARRAPGVRVIIYDRDAEKLLLTKEFRHELINWDYRLPGGKVFDSLVEYDAYRKSNEDIVVAAKAQAKREVLQEAGIEVDALELFEKSTLGATVEWDLYVFVASPWRAATGGQALEAGERIEANTWVTLDGAKEMIIDGGMHEQRIALILLQWIVKQEEK